MGAQVFGREGEAVMEILEWLFGALLALLGIALGAE